MLAPVLRSVAGAITLLLFVGCNDAVTLVVESDRPVPSAIDSICVGVADVSQAGGHFGRDYRLEDKLAALPQTLRIEAGKASAAWAWVRADHGGVPVAHAGHLIDFNDTVTLSLDGCVKGGNTAPAVTGDALGPANARLVVSHGATGQVVVAIGATVTSVLDVERGKLVATDGPAPGGTLVDAIALDVDGDCDDDLLVATTDGPPVLWLRSGGTFTVGPALGGSAVTAIAAADVDRDGDIDIVTGTADSLQLWLNDGSGTYTLDQDNKLSAAGRLASLTALALGDLDGDGSPDLVAGQAGDPLRGWVGDAQGSGAFRPTDAIVPPVPLAVTRMQMVDIDGDFDPDLAVVVAGAPLHLYIDRDGLLEDQTFARLAPPIPTANAIAIGGWDPGCEPDAIIAGDGETAALRGAPGGTLEADASAPPASDVVMVDLDDDGKLDAVIATQEGARWLVR
jgi:hypothetical protein